jgi:hypothetical protein
VDTSACKRKSRGSGSRARSSSDRQNNEDSVWSGRTTVSSSGGRRVMQKRSCTISQRPAVVKSETEAPATTAFGFSLGFNSSSSRSNSASDSTQDASTNSPRSGASDATSCESGDSDVEGIDELFFALDQDEFEAAATGENAALHSSSSTAATVDIMDFLDSMGTIEPCMLLRDD